MENQNTIQEIIRNRKSTFPVNFIKGGKIEDAVIADILETAVWAPTHKETQPWRFKVFYNEGIRQFFDKQAEIYQQTTAPEKFNKFKLKKYASKAEHVSHVVVIIAEHDENNSIPEIEETVAAACVVQNIYLQLEANNIGGYLSTGALCYKEEMRSYLGVKPDEKVIGYFQMGIPKDDIKHYQRTRIPAQDKSEWIG